MSETQKSPHVSRSAAQVLIFDDDLAALPIPLPPPPGLQLHVFERADDCLALVTRLEPVAVFMDFHMKSALKGDEAVRMLRAHFGPDLLLIGISSSPSLNRELTRAGCQLALVKGVFLRDLASLGELIALWRPEGAPSSSGAAGQDLKGS